MRRYRLILFRGLLAVLLCLALYAGAESPAPEATAAPEETPAAEQSWPLLYSGMKGDAVVRLQERLKELGYLDSEADGDFGPATKAAVKSFQKVNGLTVDGEAGPATQSLLFSDAALSLPPPPEPVDTLAGDLPMLVNKEHRVDEDFEPADLVLLTDVLDTSLVKVKYKTTKGVRTAVEALRDMLEAAREDGVTKWQISAGYRTWKDQEGMLNAKTSKYQSSHPDWSRKKARNAALRTVAEPGASEHHLGLAFDINVPGSSTFKGTRQYKWLREHCWEYGFIIRYTAEKKAITGFEAEEWHIRYVGAPHAEIMRDRDLCLEEYLEQAGDGQAEETPDGT